MSVPLHNTAQNLALGRQFVDPPGSEALLLQLAARLERIRPRFERLPEVNAAS